MSKFTTIKCWHITDAISDPSVVEKAPPTLRIFKKSILKTGYRAFASEERHEIEKQSWYGDFLLGEEVRFYINGTGFYKLVNCDLADNELYFERLNVPVGHKSWIFYSWQSDYNPSRSHIKAALVEAIEHINENRHPRQPLELVEPSTAADGSRDIVQTIKSNLDKCLFSVFDVTNVAEVSQAGQAPAKYYPNANVVFELSYAVVRKRPEQVLLVKRKRAEMKPDAAPFDFEHLRRNDYDSPAKLKQEVLQILSDFLQRMNYIQAVQ